MQMPGNQLILKIMRSCLVVKYVCKLITENFHCIRLYTNKSSLIKFS